MINDRQAVRLDEIAARLGEHFDDYLIITRTAKSGLSWRASDSTWADAASREYARACDLGNALAQAEDFRRNNG